MNTITLLNEESLGEDIEDTIKYTPAPEEKLIENISQIVAAKIPGIIYVLSNDTMPDVIKIGKTPDNLEGTIKELDNNSVALPFHCYYACLVEDMNKIEQKIHYTFNDYRVRGSRDFFRVSADKVQTVLEMIALKEVTPKKHIWANPQDLSFIKRFERRGRFKFSTVHIPIGATLYFTKDENIVASVLSDNTILYEGQILSVSEAAGEILQTQFGYSPNISVHGAAYWKYREHHLSETLHDRRLRMEE